jgi:hypothetical protein
MVLRNIAGYESARYVRFTVDLRPVNKVTVPQVWPIPHLESELARVSRATCFATFDFQTATGNYR